MSLIVDPQSVSFESVKANLTAYIADRPDNVAWKDFYASSVGETVIELMSGFSAYLAFSIIASRKETYLNHTEHISSAIGIAQGLGYSVNRGKNIQLQLTVLPTSTQVINKLDVVGSYEAYDIIAIEDDALSSGISTTINVTLGELKTETLTIDTAALKVFRFVSTDVTEDIIIKLDSVVLPISSDILDLLEDKYVHLSNAVGAVDVFYRNDIAANTFKYIVGDILELSYVELKEITFNATNLSFDYGTVTASSIISNFANREAIDKVKISAPLHHETQRLIRGRDDYKKLLLEIIVNSISTNGFDVSPAVVHVSYILDDKSILSDSLKTTYLNILDSYRPFGVQQTAIIDPLQINITLTITITLLSSVVVGSGQIDTDVQTILDTYEFKLGKTLDLEAIENAIEDLSYPKIARVVISNGVITTLKWNEYFNITQNIVLIQS